MWVIMQKYISIYSLTFKRVAILKQKINVMQKRKRLIRTYLMQRTMKQKRNVRHLGKPIPLIGTEYTISKEEFSLVPSLFVAAVREDFLRIQS